MTETEPTDEQVVEAVYEYAAEEMEKGTPEAQIKSLLVEKGLDKETAETVVTNLVEYRAQSLRAAGFRNIVFGALWCIGGIVVTAISYSAAVNGGGTYLVTWGAVVFGAVQFFRGLIQLGGA